MWSFLIMWPMILFTATVIGFVVLCVGLAVGLAFVRGLIAWLDMLLEDSLP